MHAQCLSSLHVSLSKGRVRRTVSSDISKGSCRRGHSRFARVSPVEPGAILESGTGIASLPKAVPGRRSQKLGGAQRVSGQQQAMRGSGMVYAEYVFGC